MSSQTRFNPKEAAAYLAERGCPYKPSSLEVMRAQRRGPRFYKLPGTRFVFYEKADLDAFTDLACPVETKDSVLIKDQAARSAMSRAKGDR
ncbi:MAG: hypothetical protein ABIJ57_11220 [Pseudomonadota bacterium]